MCPWTGPVRLDMTSVDVIHSFFVPAFRIKMDTVPGMQTHAWFQAQRGGSYDILCAEYCGLRHANMLSTVEVMDPDDFRTWYESTAAGDEAAIGLLESYGCTACHSLDGSEEMGPTLLNIYGGAAAGHRRKWHAGGLRGRGLPAPCHHRAGRGAGGGLRGNAFL